MQLEFIIFAFMENDAITNEFHTHFRKLPHWQQGGYTYFITFRSVREVLPENALEKVKEHILFDHQKKYELFFAVIMPDHVHILLRPLQKSDKEWYSLSSILHTLKGTSAHSINKISGTTGRVWQPESYDRMIRNEKELQEKWLYMWNNPIKAGLSNEMKPYKFYVQP